VGFWALKRDHLGLLRRSVQFLYQDIAADADKDGELAIS
jgi:hypothetical protein